MTSRVQDKDGSTLYSRQLDRMAELARTDSSSLSRMRVGIARIVDRTQPSPVGFTKMNVVTLQQRDNEIVMRYLCTGPTHDSYWGELQNRRTFQGGLSAEQALAGSAEGIAVPASFLEQLQDFTFDINGPAVVLDQGINHGIV